MLFRNHGPWRLILGLWFWNNILGERFCVLGQRGSNRLRRVLDRARLENGPVGLDLVLHCRISWALLDLLTDGCGHDLDHRLLVEIVDIPVGRILLCYVFFPLVQRLVLMVIASLFVDESPPFLLLWVRLRLAVELDLKQLLLLLL